MGPGAIPQEDPAEPWREVSDPPGPKTPIAWLVAAFWIGAVPVGSLAGQQVRGRLIDDDEAHPIQGALVTLLSPRGEAVASTVTGGDGAFVLEPPGTGPFRSRVARTGLDTWGSETLTSGSRETVGGGTR